MAQIEVSDRVAQYLAERAARGHNGNINDFLYSHFGLASRPEINEDRRILRLLELDVYKRARSLRDKYEIALRVLHKIDPIKFSTLNNFTPPNWERVVLSNNRSIIERTTTSDQIFPLPETDFHYLAGFTGPEFKDIIFHMMNDLRYPLPIRQQIRESIVVEPFTFEGLF